MVKEEMIIPEEIQKHPPLQLVYDTYFAYGMNRGKGTTPDDLKASVQLAREQGFTIQQICKAIVGNEHGNRLKESLETRENHIARQRARRQAKMPIKR